MEVGFCWFVIFLVEDGCDSGLFEHFANIKHLVCASYSSRPWKFKDEPDRHKQGLLELLFT